MVLGSKFMNHKIRVKHRLESEKLGKNKLLRKFELTQSKVSSNRI